MINSTIRGLSVTALLTGLALNFGGCTKDSPMGAQDPEIARQIVQSNVGPIHILAATDDFQTALFKGGKDKDSTFFAEKHIKANRGGKIEVGDRKVGKSKIEFKKGDLPEDLTISFQWAAYGTFSGMLNKLEFGPHGAQFNKPVKIELSYKTADVKGIDEKELMIFYFNEETELWELIGGTVDKKKKIVKGYLKHFSRYAIGWGE